MNKAFVIALFTLIFNKINSQTNFVPNGSFEDTLSCPNIGGNIYFAKDWFDPNHKSSDLFNSCSTGGFGVPQNFTGYQMPYYGNNYAGLTLFWSSVSNYREYVGVKLKNMLLKDNTYSFSLIFSHADSCNFIVNKLEVGFSSDTTGFYLQNILVPNSHYLLNQNIIDEKNNWNKATISFKANGDEKFLLIGNFNSDNNTPTVPSSGGNPSIFDYSYVYIDSLSLKPVLIEIPNIFTPNNDGINDVWTFESRSINNINTIIYDRWGLKVFETSFPVVNWDGRTTSGLECSNGIYYYIIEGESSIHKGFIQLIR